MSIFVDLVEFQKTITFVLFFLYFVGYPWELIFPLSHLSGWDVVRYFSLIKVLSCPDLIMNIVENLAYTPGSAFNVVSKFLLVESSVIIYGLNHQGALFLSHSQICIHKTVVRYSQVGHTSRSDFLWMANNYQID